MILGSIVLSLVHQMVEAAYQAGFFNGGAPTRSRGLLVVGHRLNVNGTQVAESLRLLQMADSAKHHGAKLESTYRCGTARLLAMLAAVGVEQAEDAEDYVLIRAGSFDYRTFAAWAVGTTSWDNFVVSNAVDLGLTVVDASDTLHAFHLTGKDGTQ